MLTIALTVTMCQQGVSVILLNYGNADFTISPIRHGKTRNVSQSVRQSRVCQMVLVFSLDLLSVLVFHQGLDSTAISPSFR